MYGRGLDAQDKGDFKASKDYFTLAAQEDPNFGLAVAARDKSPAGISSGIAGPTHAVAEAAIAGAVAAQGTSDSNSGIGSTSGGNDGGGGGGGC